MSVVIKIDSPDVSLDEDETPEEMPTKFDLPLEFHRASINRWDAETIRKSSALINPITRVSLLNETLRPSVMRYSRRSSRFEHLDPKILSKHLEEKESYGFLRYIGLRKLQSEIFGILHNLCKNHTCNEDDDSKAVIPFRVFSWSKDDFLTRRKLKTMTWCSVLQKQIPEYCLERQKFKFDLEELFRYLLLIFKGLFGEDESFDIQTDVVNYMDETYKFLRYHQQLLWEIDANNTIFRIEINRSLFLNFNTRDSKQRTQKLVLEEKLMNNDVWDPIEVRYQLRYFGSKADQADYKMDAMVGKYEDEISELIQATKREAYCFQCAMNTYYMEIDNFKNRIAILTTKYEQEFEHVENEIIYKKLSMDKLREQRKFFVEQIARFHEELEFVRLKELAAKERELRLQQELMEEAALKALVKGKKGKKEKKGKKG